MTGKEDESLNRLRGARVKFHIRISMATGENVLEDTVLRESCSTTPVSPGIRELHGQEIFDGLLRL
jgi:hypothetical protein